MVGGEQHVCTWILIQVCYVHTQQVTKCPVIMYIQWKLVTLRTPVLWEVNSTCICVHISEIWLLWPAPCSIVTTAHSSVVNVHMRIFSGLILKALKVPCMLPTYLQRGRPFKCTSPSSFSEPCVVLGGGTRSDYCNTAVFIALISSLLSLTDTCRNKSFWQPLSSARS